MRGEIKNETGKRYGKLVVIGFSEIRHATARWKCLCDCGREAIIAGSNLRAGRSTSCGCGRVPSVKKAISKPEGISAKRRAIDIVKRGAASRGYDWQLSDSQALTLMTEYCHYCGSAPAAPLKTATGTFIRNGIDRVDNTRGYVPGNVVPCCFQCNLSKRNLTNTEFLEWITRVYIHSCTVNAASTTYNFMCATSSGGA